MADYKPELPAEFAHLRVDTSDVRYKAAEAFAHENKLTQAQFTNLLAVEARGVVARQAAAAPAPPVTPAPAAGKIEDWDKMSGTQRLAYAIAASDARRATGEKT